MSEFLLNLMGFPAWKRVISSFHWVDQSIRAHSIWNKLRMYQHIILLINRARMEWEKEIDERVAEVYGL